MLIEVLPNQYLSRLFGRTWGYLEYPLEHFPGWVQGMPQGDRFVFLVSGPSFESSDREKKLISSEKLFKEMSPEILQYTVLPDTHEDWYLLIGDENLDNLLLTECVRDRELEDWIRRLRESSESINVYLVLKHPDQGEN